MSYRATGAPSDDTRPDSGSMRREFRLIQGDFDALPVRNNHNNHLVFVNADASGMVARSPVDARNVLSYELPRVFFKTAVESRTSSTLVADSELVVPLPIGLHEVEFGLTAVGLTTGADLMVHLNFTGSYTDLAAYAYGPGIISSKVKVTAEVFETSQSSTATTFQTPIFTTPPEFFYYIRCMVAVSAPGSLQIEWADDSNGDGVNILGNSWAMTKQWLS